MKKFLIITVIVLLLAGAFFLSAKERTVTISLTESSAGILEVPEATSTGLDNQAIVKNQIADKNQDIEPQKPLVDPPEQVRAIYLTSWSAGSSRKIDSIIALAKETDINAVVIDIKDYSGYVGYDIAVPDVISYKAKEIRIPQVNALIKKLHDSGIYIIARITVFQDPLLAKARPDLAIQSKATGGLWSDRKGLHWIDPNAKDAWDYDIAIAKDAASRGFDELNFDYIRFASDGNLNDMKFPFSDITKPQHLIIREFFKYLRESLPDVKISADLFGLATVSADDLGIGQVIEDAYAYFDYVCPMVYPSHYSPGTLGYKNPADYPYEIINYSLEGAMRRLKIWEKPVATSSIVVSSSTVTSTVSVRATSTILKTNNDIIKTDNKPQLRPWLQYFDLGAVYDKAMLQREIQAVKDNKLAAGWMFWNPSNIYEKDKLSP